MLSHGENRILNSANSEQRWRESEGVQHFVKKMIENATDDLIEKRKANNLKKLRLSELSLVDKPANEGAQMTILKAAPQQEDKPVTSGAPQDFESHVSEIMKRDKVSKSVAMIKAAEEHPDAYATYQDDGEATVQKALEDAATREPASMQRAFDQIVAKVASERGCSRSEAMMRVAREHPEAVEALNI